MPDFPSPDQIAGLVLEPQTIDGEAFLLVTVLLHETRWLDTTSYDVQVSKRSWLSQAMQVGMKDAQGVCRCWLEMGFTREQADYATYRLTRKVQRWTVQVSLEEYWASLFAVFGGLGFPVTPPPSVAGQLASTLVITGSAIGLGTPLLVIGTGATAVTAGGVGGAVFFGAGVFMTASVFGRMTGLLPSGRSFEREGWELEDALQTGQQDLDVASQQLLLAKTHALALQADGTWRSEISITSSLECRLKPAPAGVAQRVQALYCRVTETWPCGERWFPADLPRGSTVEWVGWAHSGLQFSAPPSALTGIPALYAPHTAAALAQLEGDPCCGPVEQRAPPTEQPAPAAPRAEQSAPEAPTTETPAPSNPDTIERLLPALSTQLRRAHVESLSQVLELSDAELRAVGVSGSEARNFRDQVELLLLWPRATAQDVIFLVGVARMSARRMADPREVREIASRLIGTSSRTWERRLADLGLPLTYDAAALGRALLEWTG